jgi:hypothetical protein
MKFPVYIEHAAYAVDGAIVHVGSRTYKTIKGLHDGRLQMLEARFPNGMSFEVGVEGSEWVEKVDDQVVARFAIDPHGPEDGTLLIQRAITLPPSPTAVIQILAGR